MSQLRLLVKGTSASEGETSSATSILAHRCLGENHASVETWRYPLCLKAVLSPSNELRRAWCYLKHAVVHVQGTNKSIDKLTNGIAEGALHLYGFLLIKNRGKRVNTGCHCRILMIIRVFLWIATALLEHRILNQSDP